MSCTNFETLVTTKWLADKLANRPENFVLLDASLHNPSTKRSGLKEYKEKHIPTAQFFNVEEECSDTTSKYDTMLPSPEQFAEYVGSLGIDNLTHVVIYDTNDYTFYSAPRVWWMFRVFGHQTVSLVQGGINQWVRDKYETTPVVEQVTPAKFTSVYNADMVVSYEDMQKNLIEKTSLVVDARSAARFNGLAREPRPDILPGHIIDTLSIPYPMLLDSTADTRSMKPLEEIKAVFNKSGIDFTGPIIATCGSGVTACTLVLGAFLLGYENFPMYDGSWVEWFMRAPDHQKVAVPVSRPE